MNTDVQKLVDHAAHQDMGWWGAAAVIVCVLAAGWFVRWLVKRFEEVMEDLKSSHAQQTEILVGVVVDNSKAFNSLASQMEKHTTELHEMRTTVAKCPGPGRKSDATPHGNNAHD
jgi:uncharacterized protein (DUF342 family)